MSTNDAAMEAEQSRGLDAPAAPPQDRCRVSGLDRAAGDDLGRALVAVVAIMTFLASLTTGAVMLVRAAASGGRPM